MWVQEWDPYWVAGGVAGCCLVLAAGAALFVLGAIKFYLWWSCGVCHCTTSLIGKTVLVTGASGGLGLETARELAARGARVLLACRDPDRAKQAQDVIKSIVPGANLQIVSLNLTDLQAIRTCAQAVKKITDKVDILIHNAGTAEVNARYTDDGLETTMATNLFGPFLFNILLSDLLVEGSRVVIVASDMHWLAPVNVSSRGLNPPSNELYIPAWRYFSSKLANIVWSTELARRMEDKKVTVNCLHPGMVHTDIYRHVWFPLNLPLAVIVRAFFKTPLQGTQTTIHCAISPKLDKVTGAYFRDCNKVSVPRHLDDPVLGKKLWEACENFVKLTEEDPKL